MYRWKTPELIEIINLFETLLRILRIQPVNLFEGVFTIFQVTPVTLPCSMELLFHNICLKQIVIKTFVFRSDFVIVDSTGFIGHQISFSIHNFLVARPNVLTLSAYIH